MTTQIKTRAIEDGAVTSTQLADNGLGAGFYLADAGAGQIEPLRDQRVGDARPHGGEQASVAGFVLAPLVRIERDHWPAGD